MALLFLAFAGLILEFTRADENRVGTLIGKFLWRTYLCFSTGLELKPITAESNRFGARLLVRA